MIELGIDAVIGSIYFHCPHCDRLLDIMGITPRHCTHCRGFLPNMSALVEHASVRKTYHFEREIYGTKIEN